MDSVGKNVTTKIAKDKAWSADIEKEVRAMLDEFKKTNPYTDEKAPAAASRTTRRQRRQRSRKSEEPARRRASRQEARGPRTEAALRA